MSTRAEQIIAALFSKLEAAPVLVSGNVWRTKLRPIPKGTDFAIVIKRGQDLRVADATTKTHFRQLTAPIEIYARGDVPDELADPVIESVVNRVMADRTLSGLCDEISIGNVLPDWAARDEDLVMMDLAFLVDYEIGNSVL